MSYFPVQSQRFRRKPTTFFGINLCGTWSPADLHRRSHEERTTDNTLELDYPPPSESSTPREHDGTTTQGLVHVPLGPSPLIQQGSTSSCKTCENHKLETRIRSLYKKMVSVFYEQMFESGDYLELYV